MNKLPVIVLVDSNNEPEQIIFLPSDEFEDEEAQVQGSNPKGRSNRSRKLVVERPKGL